MKKKEILAAVQLGYVISMADGDFDDREYNLIKEFSNLFGEQLNQHKIHVEISNVDPFLDIESKEGLYFSFVIMSIVSVADEKIKQEELNKILEILHRFKIILPEKFKIIQKLLSGKPEKISKLILIKTMKINKKSKIYNNLNKLLIILFRNLQKKENVKLIF